MTKEVPEGGSPDELRRVIQQAVQSTRTQGADANGVRLIRHEYGRTVLNMWSRMIPLESINPVALVEKVRDEFGSVLDVGALQRMIPEESRSQVTLESLLGHALRADDAQIVFRGGHLAAQNSDRSTPIHSLILSEQNISASVAGTTDEAEYLCKRLTIMLSEIVGARRHWTAFEPHVELISYASSTVVDLGFSLTDLLSPGARNFLADDVLGQAGLGVRMRGSAKAGSSSRSDATVVVAGVRSLELEVSVLDSISGRHTESRIEFLNHTKNDLNRSRVKVMSDLKTSDHEELVLSLAAAIRAEWGGAEA